MESCVKTFYGEVLYRSYAKSFMYKACEQGMRGLSWRGRWKDERNYESRDGVGGCRMKD
jgi:hypothetical protein